MQLTNKQKDAIREIIRFDNEDGDITDYAELFEYIEKLIDEAEEWMFDFCVRSRSRKLHE